MPFIIGRTQIESSGAAFSPTDVTGCVVWLDISQETGFSDTDPMAQLTDFSGGGRTNHALQTTLANKPLYRTGIYNSLPTARFDGTDDYMTIGASASYQSTTMSAFVVAKFVHANDWDAIWTYSDHASLPEGSGMYCYNLAGTRDVKYWVDIYNNYAEGTDGQDAGLHLYEMTFDTHTIKAWVDAAAQTPKTVEGTALSDGAILLGTNYDITPFIAMDFCEFVLFDNAVSDADRALLEAYLAAKWGL